jgi:hypothetical protein
VRASDQEQAVGDLWLVLPVISADAPPPAGSTSTLWALQSHGDQRRLLAQCEAGRRYRIEVSFDLATWWNQFVIEAGPARMIEADVPELPAGQDAFYRLRALD